MKRYVALATGRSRPCGVHSGPTSSRKGIIASAVLGFCVLASLGSEARAQGRCHGAPNPVFCDDYDTYCTPAAGSGDACDGTGALDQTTFGNVWVASSTSCTGAVAYSRVSSGDPTTYAQNSPLYDTRTTISCNSSSSCNASALGQRTVDLSSYTQAAFGPGNTTVNGTDANNLNLYFTLGANGNGALFDDSYMDLSLDSDSAPTDYVLGPSCADSLACGGLNTSINGPWPIICQQNAPPTFGPLCPPVSAFPTHASIAVGLLAHLDNNPCHCEAATAHTPSVSHLAVFDGKQWWTLKAGLFPGSGDFTWDLPRFNQVKLTIRTNDFIVEHLHKNGTQLGIATIPRQYLGPFNRLRNGVGAGCQLQPDSPTAVCTTPASCMPQLPGSGAGAVFSDTLLLYGGEGGMQTGACCMPSGTCTDGQSPADCSTAGGSFNGANTTCATSTCCPHGTYVWADKDADGDVDMDDFAAFQRCYTGSTGGVPAGCSCYDRVTGGPSGIDVNDFIAFTHCVSGPSVPWSLAVAPNCVP